MAEVLFGFASTFRASDGQTYRARACGAEVDNRWIGWIEFVPETGGDVLRTPRETTQPNRTDAVYWASGLTPVYLEGAFDRAEERQALPLPPPPETPAYSEPAPRAPVDRPFPRESDAVLDPFSVYEKGEHLLRAELRALSAWHLVNIAHAYGLSVEDDASLLHRPIPALVELIVSGVRRRLALLRS